MVIQPAFCLYLQNRLEFFERILKLRSKFQEIHFKTFPVFSPNTGKYGPEKTPYLETFHAVKISRNS